MATWAPNTKRIDDRGFCKPRTGKIAGAVPHHVAGFDGREYVAGWNARDSHPTYHVDRHGTLTGIVHPDRRPHSTAHSIDNIVVTFEIDNIGKGPDWPVAEEAVETVIVACLHHMREGGFTRAAINQPGVDQADVFVIGWHSQYRETDCPGSWLRARMQYIVDELNRRISGRGGFLMALTDDEQRRLLKHLDTLNYSWHHHLLPAIRRNDLAISRREGITAGELAEALRPTVEEALRSVGSGATAGQIADELAKRLAG